MRKHNIGPARVVFGLLAIAVIPLSVWLATLAQASEDFRPPSSTELDPALSTTIRDAYREEGSLRIVADLGSTDAILSAIPELAVGAETYEAIETSRDEGVLTLTFDVPSNVAGKVDLVLPAISHEFIQTGSYPLESRVIAGLDGAAYEIVSVETREDGLLELVYVPTNRHSQRLEDVWLSDGLDSFGALGSGGTFRSDGSVKAGKIVFPAETLELLAAPDVVLEVKTVRVRVRDEVEVHVPD